MDHILILLPSGDAFPEIADDEVESRVRKARFKGRVIDSDPGRE